MAKRLVVFVHGWGANAEDWWGTTAHSVPTHPKATGTEFRFHRFLTTRTPSYAWLSRARSLMSGQPAVEVIGELGQTLWSRIVEEVETCRCEEVLLFGHSFGGIVIADAFRHALKRESQGMTDDSHALKCIRHIALCASPMDGAELAQIYKKVAAPFGTNKHVLNLLKNNRARQDAVNVFLNYLQRPNAPSLTLFYASGDQVVRRVEVFAPFEAAHIRFSEQALEGGHSDCIQNVGPATGHSANFKRLATWLFPFPGERDDSTPAPPVPAALPAKEALKIRESFESLASLLEKSINAEPFASWQEVRMQSTVTGNYVLRIFLQQLNFASTRINSHALGSANLWVAHMAGDALHLRSEEREGYFVAAQLLSSSAATVDIRPNRVFDQQKHFERNSAGARAYLRGEPVLVATETSTFPSEQDEATGVTHVLGIPLCRRDEFERLPNGERSGVPMAITVDFLYRATPDAAQLDDLLKAGKRLTVLYRAFIDQWPQDEGRLVA